MIDWQNILLVGGPALACVAVVVWQQVKVFPRFLDALDAKDGQIQGIQEKFLAYERERDHHWAKVISEIEHNHLEVQSKANETIQSLVNRQISIS